jgi:hypothetical protein
MRALPLVLLAALLAAGCGKAAERPDGPAGVADLTVTVDPDGPHGPDPARRLHLSCTRPDQSDACGAAAGVSAADLRPTPKGIACSQIFRGPQTASIVGVLRGQRVSARFSRINGCEVKRWNGVADLLGAVR